MRPPARQLPLELGHRTGLSREELIVTGANREAAALIDRWPDWEAAVVVLAGPAGSGKSHLAAIWAERAGALAVPPSGIEAFLGEAEPGRPVLLDDADAGGLDEAGLFHLINMARGSVVDEPALIEALNSKTIMSAGLDVFVNEPHVPAELIAMDNVVLFPHLGSASEYTRRAMDQLVVDNLLAWFSGKPPLTPVPETPYPPQKRG